MNNYEIYHSLKDSQRANHKYIDRVYKNGRWVYKYAKNSVNSAKAYATGVDYQTNQAKTTASGYKTMAKNARNKANLYSEINRQTGKGADARVKALSNASNLESRAKKAKKALNKVRSQKISATYVVGKAANTVSKIVKKK